MERAAIKVTQRPIPADIQAAITAAMELGRRARENERNEHEARSIRRRFIRWLKGLMNQIPQPAIDPGPKAEDLPPPTAAIDPGHKPFRDSADE